MRQQESVGDSFPCPASHVVPASNLVVGGCFAADMLARIAERPNASELVSEAGSGNGRYCSLRVSGRVSCRMRTLATLNVSGVRLSSSVNVAVSRR